MNVGYERCSREGLCVAQIVFGAILIAMSAVSAGPAMAESIFPISIPGECVELAQREGVPVMINSKYRSCESEIKVSSAQFSRPSCRPMSVAVERAVGCHARRAIPSDSHIRCYALTLLCGVDAPLGGGSYIA